jgi:hypothetical protein
MTDMSGDRLQQFDDLVAFGVSPSIAKAQIQFRHDLPILMKEHPGKFVAYSGNQRLGIADSEIEASTHCFEIGLKDDEFLVEAIIPVEDHVIDDARWIGI